MIAIKTIIFFFALIISVFTLEDFVEKILAHLKKSEEEYHVLYTSGLIITLSILLWTTFYLLNQL